MPDLAPPKPRILTTADLRSHVYGLLITAEVALTRSFIQNVLVFDHGYDPKSVSDALGKLRKNDYALSGIRLEEVDLGEASPVHVYTFGRDADNEERKRLAVLYALQREHLCPNVIGDAGERYVAAMFRRDRRYSVKRLKLGRAHTADDLPFLDLIVTEKRQLRRIGSVDRSFGVSVKNEREFLFPGSVNIRDAFSKAKRNGLLPMLVMPFMCDTAKDRCDRDGIRWNELGNQIVPMQTKGGQKMKTIVRTLRPIIGPMPVAYQNAARLSTRPA